jgi:PAS domain S-box-containing protein
MQTIALEHLPLALALCSQDWRLQACSPPFARHLAMPLDSSQGQLLWQALGWAEAPRFEPDAQAGQHAVQARGPCGRNSSVTVRLRAQPVAGAKWQVALELLEANTNAVELLRATEERLRLAVEVARIALWDWDLRSNAIYLNREWAAMVGRDPQSYTASAEELAARMHPQDAERVRRAIFVALEDDDTCAAVYRIRTEQGNYRWVRSQGRVVARSAEGLALRMVGMYIDITEAKRAEEELREARDAATSADRAKAAFLARMSHELRTPLNGVMGMAELLRLSTLNAKQARYVEVINGSGAALLRLIDDVLEFSRLQTGSVRLVQRAFDPARLASEAAARAERAAAKPEVKVQIQLHPALPTVVTGDAERIDQLLHHLLSNAFKYTPRGEVRLTLEPLDAGAPQPGLAIEVMDTGLGMSAQTLAGLFTAFEQGDGSSTRAFGGSGLGLALVQETVQLLGGTIRARSELGQGSTFKVCLPLLAVTNAVT